MFDKLKQKQDMRSPLKALCILGLALTTASAMRVHKGAKSALLDERSDSMPLPSDDVIPATPGLGWGKAPMQDGYTTPICVDRETGKIPGAVTTSPGRQHPTKRTETTYKSKTELKIALQGLTDGLGATALQAAASSLLATTHGELQSGFELVHLQYYVPVVRHSIKNIAANCNTPPIQRLEQLASQGEIDPESINTFLRAHGTQVVHSVILGGHLSIFRVQRTSGGQVSIWSSTGTASLMSATTQKTILGGMWNGSSSTTESIMEAVNLWIKTVHAGQNLAVLTQVTTPMHQLLSSVLQRRLQTNNHVQLYQFAVRRSDEGQDLRFYGQKLVNHQSAYMSAKSYQAKIDALQAVVNSVSQYHLSCMSYTDLYNDGWVGFHACTPARCEILYVHLVLWACKTALPQMQRYNRERNESIRDKIAYHLGYRPDASAVISSGRNMCKNHHDRMFAQAGVNGTSFIQAEGNDGHEIGFPWEINNGGTTTKMATTTQKVTTTNGDSGDDDDDDDDDDKTTTTTTTDPHPWMEVTGGPPGLGWAVLPLRNDYRVPMCADNDNSPHLEVITTTASEPTHPTIEVYRSDAEIQIAVASGGSSGAANAIKSVVAQNGNKLGHGKQLVHISYYVPVSLKAISHPLAACNNQEFAKLEKLHDTGKLDDETIDRFLRMHGTRVANSVSLGGRLDVVSIKETSSMDVGAWGVDATGNVEKNDYHVNVLGGRWKPEHPSLATNVSEATILSNAVQEWLKSVQDSQDLEVLTHTTIPITALLSPKIRAKVENRVKTVTDGWMRRISTLEYVEFLRKQVQDAKESFEGSRYQVTKLRALVTVVDSLDDFCVLTKSVGTLFMEGYTGMHTVSSNHASFHKFCRQSTLWTCQIALPMMEKFIGEDELAKEDVAVLNTAPVLCASLRDNSYLRNLPTLRKFG